MQAELFYGGLSDKVNHLPSSLLCAKARPLPPHTQVLEPLMGFQNPLIENVPSGAECLGHTTCGGLTGEGLIMAVNFTMRQLLEAGVHFGHQTHRWNPKMGSYIYGVRNGIHIMDLSQTVPLLHNALQVVTDTVAKGGRVLFVGTKRSAAEQVADAAKRSAQYYVNARWLGGMLTNWKTISNSIKHLRHIDEMIAKQGVGLKKREILDMAREKTKLDKALGGIKDMGGTPDLLFVIDTNKEAIAIKEANRLGIPVVAIIDTNSDPAGVNYPIPGNDDAARAVALYCDLISRAVLEGIEKSQHRSGIDAGAAEAPIMEEIPAA
jgi:small subunit ribosomal protein S2